ncbi:MAG: hypothetical protein DRN71_01595 [Candidatus Nanohalarchaeota archaeon]|nr:MAG: hypothetical protein DRN71_01595 [Candidatus Nanohaloarchaeota archaeon]
MVEMNFRQREKYEMSLSLTLEYFKEGNSMPEIAYKMKLAFSTIEKHLQRLLADGRIGIGEVLDEGKIGMIKGAITDCGSLKEMKAKLPGDVTYAQIRYVLICEGKFKMRKAPIESAVNTYMGNYCHRKCFRHENIIFGCRDKFAILIKKIGDVPITFREFREMMNNDDIKICRLLPEKKRMYVSWKCFERMSRMDKDFWDVSDRQERIDACLS